MAHIKQIQVGTIPYDIQAVDSDKLGGQTLEQVIAAVNTAKFQVASSAATTPNVAEYYNGGSPKQGTLQPSNADKNDIYLVGVYDRGILSYYEMYIAVGSTAQWVMLGTTNMDLAGYAKDGTYTSETSTAHNTSSGGSFAQYTQEAGADTAPGTVSVTYAKSATTTQSNSNPIETDSGFATPTTKTATFTGTKATLNLEANQEGHTHIVTPSNSTLTYLSGGSVEDSGEHEHSVDSHGHSSVSVVNSITGTGNAGGHSHTVTVSSSTKTVIAGVDPIPSTIASVSNNILILSENALGGISTSTISVNSVSGATTNSVADHSHSVVAGSTNVAGVAAATTIQTSANGGHDHNFAPTTATVSLLTGVSLSTVTPGITVKPYTYTPAGTLSITMASHRHTYLAPGAHIHSISLTDTTATGTASVTVANHSHWISVGSHTHSVNDHTHDVIIR